jgi:hypothetical protein
MIWQLAVMTTLTQKGVPEQLMAVFCGPVATEVKPEADLRPKWMRPPVPLQGSWNRMASPTPVPRL